MSLTTLLKALWCDIYDVKCDVKSVLTKYFHQDYQQCINGVMLNLQQYEDHVQEQRRSMRVKHIEYKHVLEEKDQLFALYYPEGLNNKGEPMRAEVIAYFKFKDEKLLRVHGQVRLLQGDFADVDMATDV